MSEPLLLTEAEVAEVTGAKRRSGQMAWMLEHGIPAEVGNDGRVKVLRAALHAKMMPGGARLRAKTTPKLDHLRKTG